MRTVVRGGDEGCSWLYLPNLGLSIVVLMEEFPVTVICHRGDSGNEFKMKG
jgi:hypothetical protein